MHNINQNNKKRPNASEPHGFRSYCRPPGGDNHKARCAAPPLPCQNSPRLPVPEKVAKPIRREKPKCFNQSKVGPPPNRHRRRRPATLLAAFRSRGRRRRCKRRRVRPCCGICATQYFYLSPEKCMMFNKIQTSLTTLSFAPIL